METGVRIIDVPCKYEDLFSPQRLVQTTLFSPSEPHRQSAKIEQIPAGRETLPKPKYRIFEGKQRADLEAAVLEDGRRIGTIQDLLEFQLWALQLKHEITREIVWEYAMFDSSTFIAIYGRRVKICNGFKMPEDRSGFKQGYAFLTEYEFNTLQGVVLPIEYLTDVEHTVLGDKKSALENKVFRAMCSDAIIIESYCDELFKPRAFGIKYHLSLGLCRRETFVPAMRPLLLQHSRDKNVLAMYVDDVYLRNVQEHDIDHPDMFPTSLLGIKCD